MRIQNNEKLMLMIKKITVRQTMLNDKVVCVCVFT